MGLSARFSPGAVARLYVPRYWVFVKCEPDPESFCLGKGVLLRQSAKAALDAGTDVRLSGEEAEAAKEVAGSMPEAASFDPLWSPLDGLLLYH